MITFEQHMERRLTASKAASTLTRQKTKGSRYGNKDPRIKFIRTKISRLNFGTKVDGIGVRPELPKDSLIDKYNKKRCGEAIRNDHFAEHFASNKTHYFWADHLANTPEILIMVDIDVHDGVGSQEGALKFAAKVRNELFPNMYCESSTSGKGIHGYIVVQKEGVSVNKVRRALTNLDTYLKQLATSCSADISCVEIKGHPPVITYDQAGNITDIVYGQFAKVPRGAGVVDTCKVQYLDLAFLDPADIKVDDAPSSHHSGVAQSGDTSRELSGGPGKKKILGPGSFDSRIVTQDILDKLPEMVSFAAQLLEKWTGKTEYKAEGCKWLVTPLDLAQYFIVMLSIKAPPDDSLPVRRIGNLWTAVHESGDFERPWNHHRFKAIRDLISHHGHVEWVEHRYQNIENARGQACKWRLSFTLQYALESLVKGEATSVDTANNLPEGKYEFKRPKWHDFVLERQRQRDWDDERQLELMFAA